VGSWMGGAKAARRLQAAAWISSREGAGALQRAQTGPPHPLPRPPLPIHLIFRPPLQVRSFFVMCWRQSPGLYDELGLLKDMHGPLRARILRHVGAKIRPLLPILQARYAFFRFRLRQELGKGGGGRPARVSNAWRFWPNPRVPLRARGVDVG
jgi:hypothetical protein